MPIGIFDSGFGGLSVLRHVAARLPEHDLVYLGDSARAPYGGRSREEVYRYVEEAVTYLMGKESCPLVVLACNTASADALRRIQQEWLPKHFPDRRVLGVLIPVAERAAAITRTGLVGVLATSSTVSSGAYVREIGKVLPGADVRQVACPLFVPLIEAGEEESPAMGYFVEKYVADNPSFVGVDTMVLGCTHYGFIEEQIRRALPEGVEVLSGGDIVAERLEDYLRRHPEMDERVERRGVRKFVTTGDPEVFSRHGARFFGAPLGAERVRVVGDCEMGAAE
jgi:glutamate racemase